MNPETLILTDEGMLFLRFGVALLLGILVGIQREYSYHHPEEEHPAGIRTFALIALMGCASAFSSDIMSSALPFAAVLVVLGAFFAFTHYQESCSGSPGLTTAVSAMLTYFCGALVNWGQMQLAIALTVAITSLLSLKPEMHTFVKRLTRADVYGTLKFAVITAIILPILPNQKFGPPPYDVINPFIVWLFVIFISGMSFVGYVLMKTVGMKKGIGLTGLLGGIASSTALTMSLTQQSRSNPQLGGPYALAITIAWTVMFTRLVVLVAALSLPLAQKIFLPLMIPVAGGLVYCAFLYRQENTQETSEVHFVNPFELRPAITFAVLFTFIIFMSKVAFVNLGQSGVYISSIIAGLADVDAIALSMAELSKAAGGITVLQAAQGIVLAAISNTILKGLVVMGWGCSGLKRSIAPGLVLMSGLALLSLFFIG